MLDNVDQMNEQSLPRGDIESLRWAKAGRKEDSGVGIAIIPFLCLVLQGLFPFAWISGPWQPPSPLLVPQSPKPGPLCFTKWTLFLLSLTLLISPNSIRNSICQPLFRQSPHGFLCPTYPVLLPHKSTQQTMAMGLISTTKGVPLPIHLEHTLLVRTPHVDSKYSFLCHWWSFRLILFGTEASVPLLWMKWISSRLL